MTLVLTFLACWTALSCIAAPVIAQVLRRTARAADGLGKGATRPRSYGFDGNLPVPPATPVAP